jgi:hypothetical protein
MIFAMTLMMATLAVRPVDWLIVPMPNGIQVAPSPEPQPGVWRLNTETGALQFCYYSVAGSMICSLWDVPPKSPIQIGP